MTSKIQEQMDGVTAGLALVCKYLVFAPLVAFIVGVCWPVALPVGFLALWGLASVFLFLTGIVPGR